MDASQSPSLSEPPEICRFGGQYADPDRCPPELMEADEFELPTDYRAAEARLKDAGHRINPRRVDVYQLATLLIQLLCHKSVSTYLSSPRAAAAVPPSLRRAIDRALGYRAADRFETVEELLDELSLALPRTDGETPPAGRRPTSFPLANQRTSPLPFSRIDRYRILDRIGQGGMGDVYRGRDDSLDRDVAVKVLAPHLSRDSSFVYRFRREAAAAAQIHHPNVVHVYLIGEEDGQHFFAMKFIDGETLAEKLRRLRRLPHGEVLDLLGQCLAGLAAAHACGLVHRDVKPANILLEHGSGRAILVDFGLARRAGDGNRLTADGTVMGTVDYIAPEQAVGVKVDARADIYALGVIAYQMLSGRLPHEADSPTAVLFQHVHEAPVPLEEIAPDVPAALGRIVARMMAKQPQDRYQSCDEVAEDLRVLGNAPLPGTERSGDVDRDENRTAVGRQPGRYRLLLGGGLAVAVATAALVVGSRQRGSASLPASPAAARVESTISEVATESRLIDPTAGTWVSLLDHFRRQSDVVSGDWSVESNGVRVESGQAARIMVPVIAAGRDYSLEIEFTRNAGNGSVVILLPVGERACGLTLHGWEGIDGIEVIDGRRANDNATTRSSFFENQKRYRLRVDVRVEGEDASIHVLVDDEPYLEWRGKASLLATYFHWDLPEPVRPGLGAWDANVTFHSARFHSGSQ